MQINYNSLLLIEHTYKRDRDKKERKKRRNEDKLSRENNMIELKT